jgi:hypothetical protein
MPAAPRSPLEEGFLEPPESSDRHRLLNDLRGMDAAEMRRAIILREVLGPPVAWRDRDPFNSL